MKSYRRLVSFDWALKKLLRSKANFGILEGFLSELLRDDIKILEVLESESNKGHDKDKTNRVDLKVKDQFDRILIIEVQYEREYDYLQRILYGTSKVIVEHLQSGDPYNKVTKVISVNILYFDLGEGDDYIYVGKTHFKGMHVNKELQLTQKQQECLKANSPADVYPEYYLLRVNQFDDVAKDSIDEWIYFLKNEEIPESFNARGLKEAKATLDVLKLSKEERWAYEHHEEELHYQASMFETHFGDGLKEGLKKGIKKGKKEGIKEGILMEKKQIAQQLIFSKVLTSQQIAQITGLTEDEIQNLIS